nr:MAG: replication associated protein [Arizlama virus]
MSSRNCCFTIYSDWKVPTDPSGQPYGPDSQEYRDSLASDNESFTWSITDKTPFKYFIYQREVCPTTGRHHYQGYAEFTKNLTRKQQQKVLKPNCHVENRKGTQQQAIDYCRKTDTRVLYSLVEHGELAKQGLRNDLKKSMDQALAILSSGTKLKDFASENRSLFVRNYRGIEKLVSFLKTERSEKTKISIYWGASGTGKTRKVYDDAKKNNQTVYKKPNGPWWDGYDGQDVILIDDYDGYINFREFLQLNDRYPHKLPFKGGFYEFVSKEIVYTSNVNPLGWYQNIHTESFKAFQRRIEKVLYFPPFPAFPIDDPDFHRASTPTLPFENSVFGSIPIDEPAEEQSDDSLEAPIPNNDEDEYGEYAEMYDGNIPEIPERADNLI